MNTLREQDKELKPCPFCGDEVNLTDMSDDGWGNPYQIHCNTQHCLGETDWYPKSTKHELIKAWNTRTPDIRNSTLDKQWIPVSERLPDDEGWYIVAEDNTNVALSRYLFNGGWHSKYVTHWMPLPKPPINNLRGKK